MKFNRTIKRYFQFAVLVSVLSMTGCADWNSTPVVLDDNFGYAVITMQKNQTLNPEAGLTPEPVLSYDGQKGEGVIDAYRAGTIDLTKGKKEVQLDVGSEGGQGGR